MNEHEFKHQLFMLRHEAALGVEDSPVGYEDDVLLRQIYYSLVDANTDPFAGVAAAVRLLRKRFHDVDA
jgi:hypothetical protein